MKNDEKRTGVYEAPKIEYETLIEDTIMCSNYTCMNKNKCETVKNMLNNWKHEACCC